LAGGKWHHPAHITANIFNTALNRCHYASTSGRNAISLTMQFLMHCQIPGSFRKTSKAGKSIKRKVQCRVLS